jgi:membrane-bound lytic murein transglycosylase B
MNSWLNTQGPKHGWRQVSAAEAQALANKGCPTVATWKNPTGGHGHIGVIRPGQLKNGSPTMAQAGGTNFNKGTVRQGFGNKQPQYFVYEGPRTGAANQTGKTSAPTQVGKSDLGGFKSTQYDGIIRDMAAKYGVPARLIKSVIQQESQFKPGVTSRCGAQGLMQLMPGTARELGVKNAFDPRQNIEGGTKYLAKLLKMFKGDTRRALAAYNAGPGNVIKYKGIPPFRETQAYVRNIMANYNR